ncbi:MAG TPA: SUMF1/EgtB/PvdO family nonheme iron enzyme, partial [Bradyrhizobium sp.]|nr:SUMF1/EgtB/PvdO family nonheme iron enzyme [Bradyrhizobium sp.]
EALQLKAKREELAAHTFPVPVPDPAATAVSAVDQRAQSDNPQEPGKPELPEIQPLWAPYQAALKAVAAERDKKLANLDYIYLLNLDKMKKERAEAVDLDGALAVKAEMDRLGAHQATSEEQRNSMPPALRALRGSYDAALKGYLDEAARGDQAALPKYLVDLEGLQKRITMTGDLQKALLVKAERDRLTAKTSNPQPAPITPEVKVAPVPVQPAVGSTMTKFGSGRIADATKERPFVNSLGMEFVPVPGTQVLFCRWETRMKDYAEYAKVNKVDDSWTKQHKNGVPVGREPEHPVAGIRWENANAFCEWLTNKENADGKLPKGMKYRLPTDEEWSRAVGLANEEGATPGARNGKNYVHFPWGTDWPPKGMVGNYAGDKDGYATTAPVGSFPPNDFGIYDLGGNVWEWCEDWFTTEGSGRVLRGASWNMSTRADLMSSRRYHPPPGSHSPIYGFRCVVGAANR